MRFYLLLLMLGFAFSLQAQDPSLEPLHTVAQYNQKVSIYNETAINSLASDFSPSFYGDTLVFCSSRHAGPKDPVTGESFYDFYFAPIGPNGSLRSPKPFSINLNSAGHEGQAAFDLKAGKVYFTRNNMTNGVEPSVTDGKVRMKIYEATYGFLDWEQIKPLPFNSDAYNSMHPTLSEDGDFMFFSSDRPGGKGGFDLYVSRKVDGKWLPPTNLGGRINTPGNEFFPFFHQSGTLFFTSDGYKKGYGGFDLYMVKDNGEDGSWAEVVNLGAPFNTDADDFGLILDKEGKSGYFSSNREGGVGGDDIYSFDAPEGIQGVVFPDYKTTTIEVFTEEGSRPVPGAGIKIYERVIGRASGNIEYLRLPRASVGMSSEGQAQIDQRSEDLDEPDEVTNAEGKVYIMLDVSKEYQIKVEKRGFFSSEKFYMPAENRFNRAVGIPLKRDDCITLEGVVADTDSGAPVPRATVLIFNQSTQRRTTISTDERGVFKYCLPDGYRFTIVGSHVGYENDTTTVQTINRRGNRSLGVSLSLKPLPTVPRSYQPRSPANQPPAPSLGNRGAVEVGSRFVLDNLQFKFASAEIQREAAVDLDHLAQLMKENPAMRVELRAYTDCIGGEEYNRKLSLRRAEAARDFLTGLGISKDRILAFGFGERDPVFNCDCDGTGAGVPCTDDMHARNRRTEVAIIQK